MTADRLVPAQDTKGSLHGPLTSHKISAHEPIVNADACLKWILFYLSSVHSFKMREDSRLEIKYAARLSGKPGDMLVVGWTESSRSPQSH